jgi:mono/diheme cytochrome c family protein
VYEKNSAKYHGKTSEGRHFGGPSLTSEKVGATSAEELRTIISNGKGHMPKYGAKLSAEEIDALVQQIRTLNKK